MYQFLTVRKNILSLVIISLFFGCQKPYHSINSNSETNQIIENDHTATDLSGRDDTEDLSDDLKPNSSLPTVEEIEQNPLPVIHLTTPAVVSATQVSVENERPQQSPTSPTTTTQITESASQTVESHESTQDTETEHQEIPSTPIMSNEVVQVPTSEEPETNSQNQEVSPSENQNVTSISPESSSNTAFEFNAQQIRFSAAPLWESKRREGAQWTQFMTKLMIAYSSDIQRFTPRDYAQFCPQFPSLSVQQKMNFWVYLVSLMVQYESGFNPNAYYVETYAGHNPNDNVSRGLLQIGFESSKAYKCGFSSKEELFNPLKNLNCGFNILARWVVNDGVISGRDNSRDKWLGGARYWAVLRSLNGKTTLANIKKKTNELPFCR